jgi:hypothetical protein
MISMRIEILARATRPLQLLTRDGPFPPEQAMISSFGIGIEFSSCAASLFGAR